MKLSSVPCEAPGIGYLGWVSLGEAGAELQWALSFNAVVTSMMLPSLSPSLMLDKSSGGAAVMSLLWRSG